MAQQHSRTPFMDRFSQTSLGRAIVNSWRSRAIPGWPALADRLGHPHHAGGHAGEVVIPGDVPLSALAGERPS